MTVRGIRIIAGERRGWRIDSPRDSDITRPITDRVKENLFNIIRAHVSDAVVLDLFAGTGSLGLEAISRGAAWATFVERHPEAAAILKSNVAKLRYEPASRVITGDALNLRPGIRESGLADVGDELVFDIVFLDPPYCMMTDDLMRDRIGQALGDLASFGALAPDALVVVRREIHTSGHYDWPGFRLSQSRPYGSMALDFLRPDLPQDDAVAPAPPGEAPRQSRGGEGSSAEEAPQDGEGSSQEPPET